jgi:hypothetical protein
VKKWVVSAAVANVSMDLSTVGIELFCIRMLGATSSRIFKFATLSILRVKISELFIPNITFDLLDSKLVEVMISS